MGQRLSMGQRLRNFRHVADNFADFSRGVVPDRLRGADYLRGSVYLRGACGGGFYRPFLVAERANFQRSRSRAVTRNFRNFFDFSREVVSDRFPKRGENRYFP